MTDSRHVVTFGEAMLRLSPPTGVSLERAEALTVDVAGAEANVAVALARLGQPARWVSRLPENALGHRLLGKLREHGVDVSCVTFVPESRMGLYFVELAPRPRTGQVIYDRACSAFAAIDAGSFPAAGLDGAQLLHLTGITPALGPGPRAAAERAVIEARSRGLRVSFDLNYRAKLLSPEEARTLCDWFAGRADIVVVNSRDAATVLGFTGPPVEQISALKERYPQAVCVMSAGVAGAYVFDRELVFREAIPGVELDRIGRGDAFCAGLLWGYLQRDAVYGLECGVALAGLKQTYLGDLTWSTRDDLLACLAASHELQR